MRAIEIANYLQHTDPNLDLVVLDKKTYERLLKKSKQFDEIKNYCLKKIKKEA